MKSKYFKTSDGQEFYTETNAINHAKTLENKTVTPPNELVNEMEVVGAVDESANVASDKGTDGVGADKGISDDAVKVNFSRFNKAQLVEFAQDNELTIDEAATNAVIVESIEAQLIEKNQA